MDPVVFGAVLVAAACHALWNAMVKSDLDAFTTMGLIAVGSAAIALPALAVTGLPPLAVWPFALASIVLHLAYYVALTEAYRTGDMGQVYPIARGAAPLLTAAATALAGEPVGVVGLAGIVVLAIGVVLMSRRAAGAAEGVSRRAVAFALVTAVTICGYSLVDGMGARAAGSAHAYTALLFVCDGAAMLLYAARRRGFVFFTRLRAHWGRALVGGALSLAAYWIAIWAMTKAPIALVAALRETSVLFAAAIAVLLLREPLAPRRAVAAGVIVAGLVLIRLH